MSDKINYKRAEDALHKDEHPRPDEVYKYRDEKSFDRYMRGQGRDPDDYKETSGSASDRYDDEDDKFWRKIGYWEEIESEYADCTPKNDNKANKKSINSDYASEVKKAYSSNAAMNTDTDHPPLFKKKTKIIICVVLALIILLPPTAKGCYSCCIYRMGTEYFAERDFRKASDTFCKIAKDRFWNSYDLYFLSSYLFDFYEDIKKGDRSSIDFTGTYLINEYDDISFYFATNKQIKKIEEIKNDVKTKTQEAYSIH